ncbi:hypothetical protein B0J11DRAFT_174313 [Dendryphion nanum]|uniref:Uncharacterized protein n=1 Tax=Dendryphion nanum TaxID=256645 RepID=A0A9P9IZA5_9PLEO|nr:hypothetical protein B0J11DRAFT_174313 [Dendryphion nanum]
MLSAEELASLNVDALVNDADLEPDGRLSTVNRHMITPRQSTPTVPPGFSIPANAGTMTEGLMRLRSQNMPSNPSPAIPIIPTMPVRPVTPINPRKDKHAVESSNSQQETPGDATTAVIPKPTPVTPVQSKRKGGSSRGQSSKEVLQNSTNESVPFEDNVKTPILPVESPVKSVPKLKESRKAQAPPATHVTPRKDTKSESTPPVSVKSVKRQHPGKLDITAATTGDERTTAPGSAKADGHNRTLRTASLTATSSVPPSPVGISTGSPVKRSVPPRTLRVLPTPKTENAPPLPAASISSTPQLPTVEKLRSRQASVASINQPSTPVSEFVSDNASITSTSVSRANSPPPIGGKVGTAPVRKKTKSQAKKDRQERAKQIIEEKTLAFEDHPKSDLETEIAPIIGRKKKAKKPSKKVTKPTQPMVKSQPTSPKLAKAEEEVESEAEELNIPVPKDLQDNKVLPASPQKEHPEINPNNTYEQREPSTQAIIADLQRTGELLTSTLEFFKPLSSSLAHTARLAQAVSTTSPPDLKLHFSDADLDALAKKKPVRLNGQDGKSDTRTLITPQGKFFWGLTQELEEKALELEKHIEEFKNAARFHPRKQAPHPHIHNATTQSHSKDVLPAIATALRDAGAKLSKGATSSSAGPKLDSPPLGSRSTDGTASMTWPELNKPLNKPLDLSNLPPVPTHSSAPQTPADAIAYLNQFVLPKTDNPPPAAPRTETAAVGGNPGSGVGSMPANVNKIAKAAKVVAEGNVLSNELETMGVMAADLLGGVVVQGLEALVGAGLGFHSNQDLSVDAQGNVTLGGSGLDVQGLVDAIGSGGGLGGFNGSIGGHAGRRGRRSVLSIEEAEQAMLAAKKDHEMLEKKLATVMKRNKKFVNGLGKV